MHVRSLHVYPVKATAPITVATSGVEPYGLRHDRRWAVVTRAGHRLNATTHRVLLQVRARPDDDGGLHLDHPACGPARVDAPHDGPDIEVGISRLSYARDAGDAAAGWFGALVGEPVRLVWQADPHERAVSTQHGGVEGDPLNLSDAGPVLLTVTASLDRLNDWIGSEPDASTAADTVAVPMQRFRPNIVVEGSDLPFDEDTWRRVRIGDVAYRFAERCDRCSVTMVDPATLTSHKEPIRTLARHRRRDGKTWFGIRLVPLGTGTVSVGDPVVVEDAAVEAAAVAAASGLPAGVGGGRLRP